jgi:3-methyladenine DNA glycosylase/8-oxoguanine DNA glycosylase
VVESLVKTFGRPIPVSLPGLTHLFPPPEILARANLESAGIPDEQARTITALAKAVVSEKLKFDSVRDARGFAEELLLALGVKEETVAYIAMRALGDPDAFSCNSPGLRLALAPTHGSVSADEVTRIFEAYRPWRAYAAMYYSVPIQQPEFPSRPARAARKNSARSIRPRSRAFRRPRIRP